MNTPQKIFLICRAVAGGPMKPGYVGGFHCRGCGKQMPCCSVIPAAGKWSNCSPPP